ncbi:MAG: DnaB-like helicase C-terminal domain-containing protein [Burkholderiaceae bacterium]
MNLASAFIKQVIACQDSDTWSLTRKNYLPKEYHVIYDVINKHNEKNHHLPSFDDLHYSVRDAVAKEKIYAIQGANDLELDPYALLQYLKNEYAQKEILTSLEKYVDNSIAFNDAEESINELHQIVLDVEEKVDIQDPNESMQSIPLWESEEELQKYVALGLNYDYDHEIQFSPRDMILVGGRRGAGKSITCANLANNMVASGKSAIYFTIEMDSRSILQRCCSIATGVPFSRLKMKNLSVVEWEKVASWWANRYTEGKERLKDYHNHRDFDKLHSSLKSNHELLPTRQLDVVYDAGLTVAKIRATLDKQVARIKPGIVIVDYLNQVRRSNLPSRSGQYDWTEQIEVSKALKSMAQEYEVPVFSPYQTDATGEARFAKGILDAADAAYALETWEQDDACVTFNCVKMRSAAMKSFTSKMDWETLKIGPESVLSPKERDDNDQKSDEEIDDL